MAAKKDEGSKDATAKLDEAVDEAQANGYFGVKVDPLPNEAYSLESGPDGPPLVEDNRTRAFLPTV